MLLISSLLHNTGFYSIFFSKGIEIALTAEVLLSIRKMGSIIKLTTACKMLAMAREQPIKQISKRPRVHIAHWNNKSASDSVWNEGQTILKSNTNTGIRKCNSIGKGLYISPPYFHSFLTPLNGIWPFILTHLRALCSIMLVNIGPVVLYKY